MDTGKRARGQRTEVKRSSTLRVQNWRRNRKAAAASMSHAKIVLGLTSELTQMQLNEANFQNDGAQAETSEMQVDDTHLVGAVGAAQGVSSLDDEKASEDDTSSCGGDDEAVEDFTGGTEDDPAYFSDKDAIGEDDEDDENVAEDVEEKPVSPLERFAAWWMEYKNILSREGMDNLLKICREEYDASLPKHARTLEEKVDAADVIWVRGRTAAGGHDFAHLGLKNGLLHAMRGRRFENVPGGTLELWLHVDGVAKFASAGVPGEFWPILARIKNIPGLEDEPFVVSVSYGRGKPDPEILFSNFKEELHKIREEKGLLLDIRDEKRVAVKLGNVIADAPARAMLKGVKGHTGKASCERCFKKAGGYNHGAGYFTAETLNVTLRDNVNFRNRDQEEHHTGVCVLEEFHDLDMITLFPLDPMHLVYQGAVNRMMFYLFKKPKMKKGTLRIRGKKMEKLSLEHGTYAAYCPDEYQRRPVDFGGVWKAVTYRLAILVTLPVLLLSSADPVPEQIINMVLLLHCAIRVLVDVEKVKDPKQLEFAQKCLDAFLTYTSAQVLGPDFVVYNVHSLTHLVEEVKNQGGKPLEAFSAFFGENYFRHMLFFVKAPRRPQEQLVRGLLQERAVQKKKTPNGAQPTPPRATQLKLPLDRRGKFGVKPSEGLQRYRVCYTKDFKLDVQRPGDRYCEILEAGGRLTYVECAEFTLDEGVRPEQGFVVGHEMVIVDEEFYKYPCKASAMGIRMDAGTAVDRKKWPIRGIRRKLFRLPTRGGRHVMIPLLHSTYDAINIE